MATKKFINNESNEAVELDECKLTKSLNDYEARVKRIPNIDKNYVDLGIQFKLAQLIDSKIESFKNEIPIHVALKGHMGTGKDQKITIQSTSLSDDDIKKMQEDAEGHAEEDKKKKEAVDIKNEAESFIYTTEKLVNQDLKDKIPQEKGIQITDAIKELKDSLSQDTEQIKQKLEALKIIVNEVTTELYKNASPPPGEQQSDSNQEKSDSNEQQSYANEEKSDSNSEQKSENN